MRWSWKLLIKERLTKHNVIWEIIKDFREHFIIWYLLYIWFCLLRHAFVPGSSGLLRLIKLMTHIPNGFIQLLDNWLLQKYKASITVTDSRTPERYDPYQRMSRLCFQFLVFFIDSDRYLWLTLSCPKFDYSIELCSFQFPILLIF